MFVFKKQCYLVLCACSTGILCAMCSLFLPHIFTVLFCLIPGWITSHPFTLHFSWNILPSLLAFEFPVNLFRPLTEVVSVCLSVSSALSMYSLLLCNVFLFVPFSCSDNTHFFFSFEFLFTLSSSHVLHRGYCSLCRRVHPAAKYFFFRNETVFILEQ